ncbi:WD repeat-containing protein 78 [Fasciola gigantica]|uniref:Dynein axonemal intermediate chain 4 n=1 Tax=Fasciola gigantica TaxID=46835 RepID=A0A504YFW3_FASGI|nr:WD repeat-containing protein 78 [Fasciola gigantica]
MELNQLIILFSERIWPIECVPLLFVPPHLMVLKRSYVTAPGSVNSKSKRNESLISRTAFGCSIAFNKREPSIYVVGTEEGPIHKCSCSYNEQYLDTFLGHTASVYEIEWSPFLSDVFLSCSADWTIKVWHLDHQQCLINIQTNVNVVSSISWSPHNSIIFASANEGALEIWNLDHSTIDPFVLETVSSDANMTSVLFSESSESFCQTHTFDRLIDPHSFNPFPKLETEHIDTVQYIKDSPVWVLGWVPNRSDELTNIFTPKRRSIQSR